MKKITHLPKLLSPDYRKPLSQVLLDAVWFCVEEKGIRWPFAQINNYDSSFQYTFDLPTWAQWWPPINSPAIGTPFKSTFSANLGVAFEMRGARVEKDATILCARGFILSDVNQRTVISREKFGTFEISPTFINEAKAILPSTEGLAEVLVGGEIDLAELDPGTTDVECYDAWTTYCDREKRQPVVNDDTLDRESDVQTLRAVIYQEALNTMCLGRRLFTTSLGHAGLGPQSMDVGDTVAILYGSSHPVVLRQKGDFYTIVGMCYVQGIMEGQAVTRHREAGGEDTVFQLK